MEDIPFKVIITGTVQAYNKDHAFDLIEEEIKETTQALEAREETIVIQAGDNIRQVYLNVHLPYREGTEEIKEHYKEFIREILKDLEEAMQVDYLEGRWKIMERIAYWKQIDSQAFGYPKPKQAVDKTAEQVTRKIIDTYYAGLAKSIIAAAVTEEEYH